MSNEFDVFDQIAQSNVANESRRPTGFARIGETVKCAAEVVQSVGLVRLFNAQKKRTAMTVVMKSRMPGRQSRHSADRFVYDRTRD